MIKLENGITIMSCGLSPIDVVPSGACNFVRKEMTYIDKYFDETYEEFPLMEKNDNVITFIDNEAQVKVEFSDDGENIKIIEHNDVYHLIYDADIVSNYYDTIKSKYTKDNWLAIIYQTIFDLGFITSLDQSIDDVFKYVYVTQFSIKRLKIKSYIENHRTSSVKLLPLVFLSDEDYKIATEFLNKHDFKREENIKIKCKHYPYLCDEVKFDHKSSEHCKCIGKCGAHDNDINITYTDFSWGNEYMHHHGNCYDDCCCISNIFVRYAVTEI